MHPETRDPQTPRRPARRPHPSSRLRRSLLGPAAALLAVFALAAPGNADAQIDWGVRGGVYTDVEEGFLGGEILGQIGDTRWFYNPNVEVVFVDPGDLVTANADFHYDLVLGEPVDVWVGGGPALVFRDRGDRRGPGRFRDDGDDETDIGLNAQAGVGFNRGGAIPPYLQGKVLFSDDTEAVIAFGLRFF